MPFVCLVGGGGEYEYVLFVGCGFVCGVECVWDCPCSPWFGVDGSGVSVFAWLPGFVYSPVCLLYVVGCEVVYFCGAAPGLG